MYLNLNGISTLEEPKNKFWVRVLGDDFIFKENDQFNELIETCNSLRNKFAGKVFGSLENYYSTLQQQSSILQMGGIDAECNISKKDFEKYVNSQNSEPDYKILYFYDCSNVIETLQNSILETRYLFGMFYKTLNQNSFLINDNLYLQDDYQYASGPIVTNITSVVNHLFINLYSQLDFTTKILYEYENIQTDFKSYPKLKCDKILYGNGNKLSLNKRGSIYEKSDHTMKIITLRNEIVHNSSIDNIPKVYYKIKSSKVVEKFILIPDFKNGVLEKFKNRNRFFYDETKLNLILPDIIFEHCKKLLYTVQSV